MRTEEEAQRGARAAEGAAVVPCSTLQWWQPGKQEAVQGGATTANVLSECEARMIYRRPRASLGRRLWKKLPSTFVAKLPSAFVGRADDSARLQRIHLALQPLERIHLGLQPLERVHLGLKRCNCLQEHGDLRALLTDPVPGGRRGWRRWRWW